MTVLEDDDFVTCLKDWPVSWCEYCNENTPYDGWEIGEGGVVEFFCYDCGKRKDTEKTHVSTLSRELQAEIFDVMAMSTED